MSEWWRGCSPNKRWVSQGDDGTAYGIRPGFQPIGDMTAECDDLVGLTDQPALQKCLKRITVSRMRLRVVDNDHDPHASPTQHMRHQQIQRTRHRTDRYVRTKVSHNSPQLAQKSRRRQQAPHQPLDGAVGRNFHDRVRSIPALKDFRPI